jgi:hypothetical protein
MENLTREFHGGKAELLEEVKIAGSNPDVSRSGIWAICTFSVSRGSSDVGAGEAGQSFVVAGLG